MEMPLCLGYPSWHLIYLFWSKLFCKFMWTLILYSKPGCHLCEGLAEKLSMLPDLNFELEIRDILTNSAWFAAYQYEIPVLICQHSDAPEQEKILPRPSPRLSVEQLRRFLQSHLQQQS
jgi:hypothetical protein